jgi:DNA-binding transcriptional MerR regulator
VYSAKDLQRLDEILALKFVGLPLDQIKALLDSPARSLAEALRAQRRRLKIERRRITRAMRAIRDAERRSPRTDNRRWSARPTPPFWPC